MQTSARRIIRLCTQRGRLDAAPADPLADEEPVLAALTAASVRGIIATGERAGQRLRCALKDPATGVRTAPLCFARRGFSLHAATRIAGPDRLGLERLCRYVAQPALASERRRIIDPERLSFALKTPWSDGMSHLLLSPMERLEKRAALVPPPRLHLLRCHGVLAPRARDRALSKGLQTTIRELTLPLACVQRIDRESQKVCLIIPIRTTVIMPSCSQVEE